MRGAQMCCLAVLFAIWVAGSSVAAADCPTELKPTDRYQELSAILKCLNDEIAALKAERAPSKSAQGEATPRADAPPPMGEVVDSVLVQLIGCSRPTVLLVSARPELSCKFVVFPSRDGSFQVDAASYAITDTGEQMKIVMLHGTNVTKPALHWDQRLFDGVRMENTIEFGGISIDTKSLARMQLNVAAGGAWKSLLFRNVPVHRGSIPQEVPNASARP